MARSSRTQPATTPSEPTGTWPELPVESWTDTRDTLHMWTQIVGKIRLARAPMLNHWWQVPLYVSPRGLTTSSVPHGTELFDIEFDFVEHQLRLRSSDGASRTVALEPKTVAQFHDEVRTALAELDLTASISDGPSSTTSISDSPVEVQRAIPSPRTPNTPPTSRNSPTGSGDNCSPPTAC